jgi:thiosulfate dehydrogenase [quinone] large subunit
MKDSARIIELFLRLALAAGFLSAVADRFGWWSPEISD